MGDQQKYNHCMVLAGGGFRFAYYLGMYAAADEHGQVPDLLLATCGGALAAAAICAFPDHPERKAWLASPEMYDYLRAFGPGPTAGVARSILGLVTRVAGQPLRTIPDLFEDYMFALPGPLPLPPAVDARVPDWAIIGTRLEFGPHDVGQRVQQVPIFTECVFGNGRVAALVHGMQSPMHDTPWSSQSVTPSVDARVFMPLNVAARISMADPVYFQCYHYEGRDYTGGVLDLFPIEIAHRLANRVSMEGKSHFARLSAAPALRSVMGIDANARLRHVHRQRADYWIDTSDASKVLRHHCVRKSIQWKTGKLGLTWPAELVEYQAQIEAQWNYGYARACEAYKHSRVGLPRLRVHNRLNMGRL